MNDAQYPWLKHYPQGIDWHEQFTGRPVYALLDAAAERYPENIALEFFGKNYRYRELKTLVDRAAGGLAREGVGPGTRVGIFMPNCPQFVISYYAILKAGATVVNFNPLYSEREIEHQIRDAEVEYMVTVNLNITCGKLAPFLGTTTLKRIIIASFQQGMSPVMRLLFTAAKAKELADIPADEAYLPFRALLDAPPLATPPVIAPEKDVAVLQYTGGTTGVPKGAILTHSNLYINTQQCTRWMVGLEPGKERMLAVLPFFHVFAMTVAMNLAIASGFAIIIHPRFEMKRVLRDIQAKNITLMPGVSTLFAAISNYTKVENYDLSSIKMCISGGGPLPVEVKARFEQLTGCVIAEGYGLTEASPVTCCTPLFGINKPGSIGLPFPGTIMEIIDKDDKTTVLPPGEVGEVTIRGPQVMAGYLNKSEETAAVLRGGRLFTGDLGTMDAEGYFTIVDRLKEMIIVAGYNVYPRNVEEVLYMHPEVAEAAVVGLDHPLRGQMIKAYIVPRKGAVLNTATLKEFMRERISAYAIPHAFEFRDSLPKSMIGKILKKELLAQEKRKEAGASES
jgi:long-chain acyl-CoA synthetase